MQRKLVVRYSVVLSLLLHLLFALSILTTLNFYPTEPEKASNDYVPAYTYQPAVTRAPKLAWKPSTAISKQTQPTIVSERPVATRSSPIIAKPQLSSGNIKASQDTKKIAHPSILASTLQMFHQDQMQAIARPRIAAEPMLLIGDERLVADPFRQLVGKSLSAHFNYPAVEGRMGVKGQVLIELTLHPEGYFDDVQIIQSSNSPGLDSAALYAVNNAPKIKGLSRYLPHAKRFVVGFIFS